MKAIILFKSDSPSSRDVEEFVRNLKSRQPDVEVQLLDVDQQEGENVARIYDVVRYPAVLVIRDDQAMQKLWQEESLPTIDEVMSYLTV